MCGSRHEPQSHNLHPLVSSPQYKVDVGELRSRTLNLSVWHAESLGRNVFLGEVEVSLGLWDWSYTQPLWQDLQPRVGGPGPARHHSLSHPTRVPEREALRELRGDGDTL